MRMRRQPTSRLFRSWSRCGSLCALAALSWTLTASAGVPEKAKPNPAKPLDPANAPLFEPYVIRTDNMAALTIGSQFAPQSGPWCAFSALVAGSHPDVHVWDLRGALSTKPGRIQVGASSLFLAGFGPAGGAPLVELATLKAGDDRKCWDLIDTDRVRPIPGPLLSFIRDRHGIFNGSLEIDAYSKIIAMAYYTSAKAFAQAARHDVTYTHLFTQPEQYRGQVVHLPGRLVKLRRFDPQDDARGEGVGDLYEAWIMNDAYGENPFCAVFTVLPPGLKIDGDRRLNIDVSFDGYFYKRYRYKAFDSKKPNQFRDAPLLIGHTLNGQFGPEAASAAPDSNWGHNLLWVFVSLVGGAVAIVAGLTCWFRYNDKRVRHRISAMRHTGFVPPPSDDNGFTERSETPVGPSAESEPGPRWSEFPQPPR